MSAQVSLSTLDWLVIGVYLVVALGVGFSVKGKAEAAKESYFLADRGLPWWWAGASIAATTFAADTPLAVTGIIASKGISGNWIWLSWIGVHAAGVEEGRAFIAFELVQGGSLGKPVGRGPVRPGGAVALVPEQGRQEGEESAEAQSRRAG